MKKISLLIIIVIVSFNACKTTKLVKQTGKSKYSYTKAIDKLSLETVDLICSDNEVDAFLLAPEKKTTKNSKTVAGFFVMYKLKNIKHRQVEQLKEKVLNANNFVRSDLLKNSVFLPDVAYQFKNSGDDVIVLLDFSSNQWELQSDKGSYYGDIDKSRANHLLLAKKIFVDNNLIKSLN